MDAMKMALKKHIGKAKGHAPEGSPMEEKSESKKEEQQEDSDQAPELAGHDSSPPMGLHQPMMSGELGPEHIPLLQQLIDQISHPGRAAMTMQERSGGAMKEKMASIMKHKPAV